MTNSPNASAEEIVGTISHNGEKPERLIDVFEVRMVDIITFFKSLRPQGEVSLGALRARNAEDLQAVLLSYLKQV